MRLTLGKFSALATGLLVGSLAGVSTSAQSVETTVVGQETAAVPDATPGQLPSRTDGMSEVRIVRLSVVMGAVKLDRNTGRGFEEAFANIPIVAHSRLQTGQGIAEVEFEDDSSLRLAPDSQVSFDRLNRTAAGATITQVRLLKGTAYVSLSKTKGNAFSIVDGNDTVTLLPGSHVRLQEGSSASNLAVFAGDAQVSHGGLMTSVGKKESLLLSSDSAAPGEPQHKVEEAALDGWDKRQEAYHQAKASLVGSGGGSLYGANDLNYYGQFVNMPGCGTLWQPYFVSAGWDPFANGTWAWYPGAGYSWVSPYPWGWLPFHTGSWMFCGAGGGWGWQPGGQFYGLRNPVLHHIPKCPRHPPAPGRSTLVAVNVRPLPSSGLTRDGTFLFRKDSAGLGVPRQVFGHLRGTSSSTERHGVTSTEIYASGRGGTLEHGPIVSGDRSREVGTPLRGEFARGQANGFGSRGSENTGSQARNSLSRGTESHGSYTGGAPASHSSYGGGGSHGSFGGGAPASQGSFGGGGSHGMSSAPASAPASAPSGGGAASHH